MLDDLITGQFSVDSTTQYGVDLEKRHLLFPMIDVVVHDLGVTSGLTLRVDPWQLATDYQYHVSRLDSFIRPVPHDQPARMIGGKVKV